MRQRCPYRMIHGGVFLLSLLSLPSLSLAKSKPEKTLRLLSPGSEPVVRYESYGTFENRGMPTYTFKISDRSGLSEAVGAGVYPNVTGLDIDPEFRRLSRSEEWDGPLENFRAEINPTVSFYKWASLNGIPYQGLRMFNVGESLEKAGYPFQALKAYYAAVVHFPKEVAWVSGRPWYVGVAALDAIYRLLNEHSEWKLDLEGADIHIENGFDSKVTNDIISVDPGRWVSNKAVFHKPVVLSGEKAVLGGARVQFVQRNNDHWQLMVEGKPYLIRGMAYSPTPIGRSPDIDGYQLHSDWMELDQDENGRNDVAHDAWVDGNRNGQQDRGENSIGDFELMRRMGVNAIRLYHHGESKALLKELSDRFGIRVIMGDLLGAYTVGSNAEWEKGTDYTDSVQCEAMRESVRNMVLNHKDENYVLMWVLGNENNYGHGNNANKKAAAFYSFANSVAKMIHKMDPDRPVLLCNGDLENLELIAKEGSHFDGLAINAYRGAHGMGESFWRSLSRIWKKPVLVSEFGCPAYNALKNLSSSYEDQAQYLLSSWNDIELHAAGNILGNSIGGVVFEWLDEWWKAGPEHDIRGHDTVLQNKGPFPGGFIYEEWFGVVSQGSGESSPFLRELRPAYFAFRNGPWNRPMSFSLSKETLYGER